MGSNIPVNGSEDSSIEFDIIQDYSENAWLIRIDNDVYYMPKSQVRVYHKAMKLYAPNWLLTEKGLI